MAHLVRCNGGGREKLLPSVDVREGAESLEMKEGVATERNAPELAVTKLNLEVRRPLAAGEVKLWNGFPVNMLGDRGGKGKHGHFAA